MRNIFFTLSIITSLSLSAQTPIFLWDNQEGMVDASSCSIVDAKDTKFRISSSTKSKGSEKDLENLRNYRGAKQSHLIVGSLVKFIDGKSKANYKKVEVVGVNQNTSRKETRWISDRLDRGYLYHKSIKPMDNHVLHLVKGAPKTDIIINEKNLENTLFTIEKENGSYQKLDCPELTKKREYTVFKMLSNSNTPAAYVGVYWDETKIFQSFKTVTSREAEKLTREMSIIQSEQASKNNSAKDESSTEKPIKIDINSNEEVAGVIVNEGAKEELVCISKGVLSVRDESLENRIFTAKPQEPVLKFSGWGAQEKETEISGKTYSFVKVKFTSREEKDEQVGWVAKDFITTKSACPYKEVKLSELEQLSESELTKQANKAKSITSSNCCIFPVQGRPLKSYTSGMRKFGSGRSNGRLHAATDLYRYKNEPVVSVAPGKVVIGLKKFYFNSYSIVVKHVGGHIARYGEVTGKKVSGTSYNSTVKANQRIGYVQRIITRKGNRLPPMLHFELYSGSRKGDLTQSNTGRYKRRRDLINPTKYIQRWEKANFGKNY